MIITIDLDGVIFDLNQINRYVFKENNLDYISPKSWDMNEYPNHIRNEIYKRFKTNDVANTPIINNKIRDTLYVLNLENSIYFVSSRFKELHKPTIERMLYEFPFLDNSQIILTDNQSKIPILKHMKSDLHIDDSPYVIQECLNNEVNCIMISNGETQYNHSLRNKVFHMKSLDNIKDYLYSFYKDEYLPNFNLAIRDMFIKNH